MADLGRWFKLWCSAVHDPDLDNLSLENFARWAKLGAIIKEQGNGGIITLSPPSILICAALKCETFDILINVIKMLPHVGVSPVTVESVSFSVEFKNWHKYQGDFSTDRVKKFRAKKGENETPKRRGEERRKEENKIIPKREGTIPLKSKNQPSKEEITEASETKIEALIKEEGDRLYQEKIFPKVHGFINYLKKEKQNPRTILHVLCRLYLSRPSDPWAYGIQISKIENGNYNERDHQKST